MNDEEPPFRFYLLPVTPARKSAGDFSGFGTMVFRVMLVATLVSIVYAIFWG